MKHKCPKCSAPLELQEVELKGGDRSLAKYNCTAWYQCPNCDFYGTHYTAFNQQIATLKAEATVKLDLLDYEKMAFSLLEEK